MPSARGRTRTKWIEKNPPDKDGYYVCALCKQRVHVSVMTLDHIYPQSLYPELKHDLTNLQPTHKFCNINKGNGREIGNYVQKYGRARRKIW